MNIPIEAFYKKHSLEDSFDEINYAKHNPNLVEFYQPYCKDHGISDKHRLFYHWFLYGDKLGQKPFVTKSQKQITQNLVDMHPDANREIYLKPTNGLANRLLNINSFIVFAKTYGFNKVNLCWSSGQGFSEENFDELFDISNFSKFNIELITEEQYNLKSSEYPKLEDLVSQHPNTHQYEYAIDHTQIIRYITNKTFCYSWFSAVNYMFPGIIVDDFDFIRSLKPSSDIKELISKCKIPLETIGLHIRRGDSLKTDYADRYNRSSVQSFINFINCSDNAVFFMATDCYKAQEKIRTSCVKNNIITYPKNFVDDTICENDNKPNQKDAVAEMFLLSQTQKIYGTYYSTYGKVASLIQSKPYENLTVSKTVRISNNYLPALSVVMSVKNRFDMLTVSINSLLLQKNIQEVLIIDWDSDDINTNYLKSLDSRVRVLTYTNKPLFSLAESLNRGIEQAQYSHILKLDVDYIINPYYQLNQWLDIDWDSEFMTGHWKQKELDNNMGFVKYLNGLVICKKDHLLRIGGYDELYKDYGWEDTDLYTRLESNLNLQRRYLPIDPENGFVPIYHNPHMDYSRSQYYFNKDIGLSLQLNASLKKSNKKEQY